MGKGLHYSKSRTWKWRLAPCKANTLYMKPFMSFHVEGTGYSFQKTLPMHIKRLDMHGAQKYAKSWQTSFQKEPKRPQCHNVTCFWGPCAGERYCRIPSASLRLETGVRQPGEDFPRAARAPPTDSRAQMPTQAPARPLSRSRCHSQPRGTPEALGHTTSSNVCGLM